MRVNSSHSIGTLQTVPRTTPAAFVVEEYQSSKPLTIVKSDRKITEIKRVQSNSTNVVKVAATSPKADLPEGEEQGIRVFQMNELNRKSCC